MRNGHRGHIKTQIALNRLSTRNVRRMLGEVAAQKALSEETIATVLERTGGVPLFVEELTRAVLESMRARARDGGPWAVPILRASVAPAVGS